MTEQRHFCTLFDASYLLKGVAMMRSLKRYCPESYVFVLCLDRATQDILEKLDLNFVTCIPIADIENGELLRVKGDRGVAEYCWTLSPCLPSYIFETCPEINFITYVDADLLFYAPVQPLFDEIGNASIAIIEHRFSPKFKGLEIYGRFCVEWVSFRRNEEGLACLSRWRGQCINWCYNRLEDGKMGDQKYLDEWPDRYAGCHILMHPGAGIAPWNFAQYRFDTDSQGNITVDESPLIFYHFHQFQLLDNGSFDRLSSKYTEECREPEAVYAVYETTLTNNLREIHRVEPGFSGGLKPVGRVWARRFVQRHFPLRVKNALRYLVRA